VPFLLFQAHALFRVLTNQEKGIATFTPTGGQMKYELKDHLGNVRAVVAAGPSGAEELLARSYYPFGYVMHTTGSDQNYRFGYQGDFAEDDTEETGFNHFEAREYNSRVGRWMVVDPAREFASPYNGMGNNPINNVDPTGEEICPECPDVAEYDVYRNSSQWFGYDESLAAAGEGLGGLGVFNSSFAMPDPFRTNPATLQAWDPSLMQNWSMNQNFFAQVAYSSVDNMYVTGQSILLQHQRSHLDGQPVVGEEGTEALIGVLSDRIPISRLAKKMKYVKKLNAAKYSKTFKGTPLAGMKPKLRGGLNRAINKQIVKAHSGKTFINWTGRINEAEKQGIIEWFNSNHK